MRNFERNVGFGIAIDTYLLSRWWTRSRYNTYPWIPKYYSENVWCKNVSLDFKYIYYYIWVNSVLFLFCGFYYK